jgi:hypothetical protein
MLICSFQFWTPIFSNVYQKFIQVLSIHENMLVLLLKYTGTFLLLS